jgi:hypothetical protein
MCVVAYSYIERCYTFLCWNRSLKKKEAVVFFAPASAGGTTAQIPLSAATAQHAEKDSEGSWLVAPTTGTVALLQVLLPERPELGR